MPTWVRIKLGCYHRFLFLPLAATNCAYLCPVVHRLYVSMCRPSQSKIIKSPKTPKGHAPIGVPLRFTPHTRLACGCTARAPCSRSLRPREGARARGREGARADARVTRRERASGAHLFWKGPLLNKGQSTFKIGLKENQKNMHHVGQSPYVPRKWTTD